MGELRMKTRKVYEVLEGGTVVCSAQMGLSKREALNKCENERRIGRGTDWSVRPRFVLMEEK